MICILIMRFSFDLFIFCLKINYLFEKDRQREWKGRASTIYWPKMSQKRRRNNKNGLSYSRWVIGEEKQTIVTHRTWSLRRNNPRSVMIMFSTIKSTKNQWLNQLRKIKMLNHLQTWRKKGWPIFKIKFSQVNQISSLNNRMFQRFKQQLRKYPTNNNILWWSLSRSHPSIIKCLLSKTRITITTPICRDHKCLTISNPKAKFSNQLLVPQP